MYSTKLFLAPPISGLHELHLIASYFGRDDGSNTLFTSKNPANFAYKNFSFTENILEANYILIPNSIKKLDQNIQNYLDSVRSLAKRHNKKVIVFIGGDLSHDVFIDDMIVFKGSQYKYMMRSNEIIVPPFAEDLLEGDQLTIRKKSKNTNQKPVVGFCGWAGFANVPQLIKYHARNLLINFQKIFRPHLEVHKKGLYFRRKAIQILQKSQLVSTNFIIRNSFSANTKTISLDPVQARKEYKENIISSDFVLTPKGDANFSVRFFEVLTLGRIPILIDTETVLPLENVIDYSEFMLKVNYRDLKKLPEIISEFYANLTPDQFSIMQHKAREAYELYLRYDRFFSYVFSGPVERLLREIRK